MIGQTKDQYHFEKDDKTNQSHLQILLTCVMDDYNICCKCDVKNNTTLTIK